VTMLRLVAHSFFAPKRNLSRLYLYPFKLQFQVNMQINLLSLFVCLGYLYYLCGNSLRVTAVTDAMMTC
jgi:hypothetical protein